MTRESEQRARDEALMARALELAKRGEGWTSPNPLVGAAIVKDGRIIGEGWHTAYGQPHAEREALAACVEDPAGSTLYVTLEPCCHWGKTPPCTSGILEAGIARVVVGALDPNPLVAGSGCAQLREAGLMVETGVLEERCRRLNEAFFHFITTGRPLVVAKYAMTLDGKVATHTGASRWITGPEARARVHRDRHRFAAIMVGIGTALIDNPALTCRLEGGPWRQPLRVVVDSHGRLPLDAELVRTAREIPTLIAVAAEVHNDASGTPRPSGASASSPEASSPGDKTRTTRAERLAALRDAGCTVWVSPPTESPHAGVNLSALLEHLGSLGIDSALVEGGPTLHGALADSGLVNRVQAYIAPKLFGGAKAPGPVGGQGAALPADGLRLSPPTITALGADLLLECAVQPADTASAASPLSREREVTLCSPAS